VTTIGWDGLCKGVRRWAWLGLLLASAVMAEGLGLTDEVLQLVQSRYGLEARGRVQALQQLVAEQRHANEADKLAAVNDFFNQVPYDTDQALWQQEDYWATPVEMLGMHGADCEDYAIAKYFTLLELGVPAERLRITYVKALTLNQAHMVLAYYEDPAGEPVILDNINPHIRPAGKRLDLVPVYSFNGDNLWLAVNRSRGKKVGGSERISLWNELRRKMAEEGVAKLTDQDAAPENKP
jgi:predicted transglutaminase-like cysteine proteinase